jgi:hypothetical protein
VLGTRHLNGAKGWRRHRRRLPVREETGAGVRGVGWRTCAGYCIACMPEMAMLGVDFLSCVSCGVV